MNIHDDENFHSHIGSRLCRVHVSPSECAGVGRRQGERHEGAWRRSAAQSEDIDAEGDVYFADDATCKDGKYDITLDKGFKIVKKEKED